MGIPTSSDTKPLFHRTLFHSRSSLRDTCVLTSTRAANHDSTPKHRTPRSSRARHLHVDLHRLESLFIPLRHHRDLRQACVLLCARILSLSSARQSHSLERSLCPTL